MRFEYSTAHWADQDFAEMKPKQQADAVAAADRVQAENGFKLIGWNVHKLGTIKYRVRHYARPIPELTQPENEPEDVDDRE